MFRNLINLAGKHLIRYNNPRVVCPPGDIPQSAGQPILVASIMRSGTHLAIDLLLNNFPALANSPLYIDADQYFRWEENRTRYLQNQCDIGTCVMKTHYPQSIPKDKLEVFEQLAKESHVILLHRPIEQTFHSTKTWGLTNDMAEYRRQIDAFYAFWERVAPDCLRVNFDELVNPEKFQLLVEKIASETGLSADQKIRYPVNPNKIMTMVLTKLSTRVFGKRSPVINTGIRSGMSGR
ncbi:hypothetical protein [Microbulbifer agarilyticus]